MESKPVSEWTGDITYGTSAPIDIDEMIATMRRLRREHEAWQESTRVAMQSIEPCRVCGKRITFETMPYERYVMCRCMFAELKRQYGQPNDVTVPAVPSSMGIAIEVR